MFKNFKWLLHVDFVITHARGFRLSGCSRPCGRRRLSGSIMLALRSVANICSSAARKVAVNETSHSSHTRQFLLSFWIVENKDIYMCTELGATPRTRRRGERIYFDKGCRELGTSLCALTRRFATKMRKRRKDGPF